MKLSSETLQNLPYFLDMKIQTLFFHFSFEKLVWQILKHFARSFFNPYQKKYDCHDAIVDDQALALQQLKPVSSIYLSKQTKYAHILSYHQAASLGLIKIRAATYEPKGKNKKAMLRGKIHTHTQSKPSSTSLLYFDRVVCYGPDYKLLLLLL